MDIFSSWNFVLWGASCLVVLVVAVSAYALGNYVGCNKGRIRLIKDKSKRNNALANLYRKERHNYILQIDALRKELSQLTIESELYVQREAEIATFEQKLREYDRALCMLSSDTPDTFASNIVPLLVQLKGDPVRTNLSKAEWNELLTVSDLLFNLYLTKLKDKFSITRHEQEICCLIKWNFSRKDQLAVFNNTAEALAKSKNRLKKRLQLDEKVDIDQYIRLY